MKVEIRGDVSVLYPGARTQDRSCSNQRFLNWNLLNPDQIYSMEMLQIASVPTIARTKALEFLRTNMSRETTWIAAFLPNPASTKAHLLGKGQAFLIWKIVVVEIACGTIAFAMEIVEVAGAQARVGEALVKAPQSFDAGLLQWGVDALVVFVHKDWERVDAGVLLALDTWTNLGLGWQRLPM